MKTETMGAHDNAKTLKKSDKWRLMLESSGTFTDVKYGWLLSSPTPPTVVADVSRLLAGASRTTRIHVLSLTPVVPTSVRTDLVLGPVLLLAGDGLLMVVNGVRFALLGLRVLSTLGLTSLDGMLALLMRTCPLLAFRSSLALGLFFSAHVTPPRLHLTAIAADLFRSVAHTVGDCLGIGPLRVGKRVLVLGGTVADPLLGTVAIRWADIPPG